MKYKDLMNEMYGIPVSKKVKEEKPVKRYALSETIRESNYYDNMTPMDKYNIERYINKEIKLFEGVVGFSKADSLASGVEVPNKYIMELKKNNENIKK
jgi:hypothetical protein